MIKKKKFRLGGIPECMVLAIFLSVWYLGLVVMFPNINFPLFHNGSNEIFTTFFLLIPSNFIILSLLEIFWFERDLNCNGRNKELR